MTLVLLAGALPAFGCERDRDERERVLLVTTTSVEGSGLLDALTSAYHASQTRYRLATTAVGSGAALEMGRRGDADVLITHDPTGEARFMDAGHGVEQGPLMWNEYVVAGPSEDPAGIRGMTELAGALDRVARSEALFISRGDDSGTHRKEQELWVRAGRPGGNAPRGDRSARWHVQAGTGMAEALRMAEQRRAYILTDTGTFGHLAATLDLEELARGEPVEINRYQYTLPERLGNDDGARDFVAWLRGPGRVVIADFGVARFGKPLFTPVAPPGSP
jgi:tungstate transport system substrate-binding protein